MSLMGPAPRAPSKEAVWCGNSIPMIATKTDKAIDSSIVALYSPLAFFMSPRPIQTVQGCWNAAVIR